MSQEELWLDCAEKLTAMIQQIIEFAKLIPGFMRLSQDDQVWIMFIPILSTANSPFLFLDSPAQDGLVRAGHRAHVPTDGSLNQLRPVRGHHAAAGGVLHVRFVRDETGGVYIRNGEEHRRAEADGDGTGAVPEFGAAMAW